MTKYPTAYRVPTQKPPGPEPGQAWRSCLDGRGDRLTVGTLQQPLAPAAECLSHA